MDFIRGINPGNLLLDPSNPVQRPIESRIDRHKVGPWVNASASRVPGENSPHHAIGLHQFPDAGIQRTVRRHPRVAELGARHNIVALIGIAADVGEMNHEPRDVVADFQGEFLLGQIRGVEAEVVALADHVRRALDAVQKTIGDVLDMHVVSLVVPLEHHQVPVSDGRVDEWLTSRSVRMRGETPNTVARRNVIELPASRIMRSA